MSTEHSCTHTSVSRFTGLCSRCPRIAIALVLGTFGGGLLAQGEEGPPPGQQLIFPIVHSAFADESVNFQTVFSFSKPTLETVHARLTAFEDDGTAKGIFGLCSSLGIPSDPDGLEWEFEIPDRRGSELLTGTDNNGDLPGFSGWARVVFEEEVVDIRGSAEVLLRTSPEGCIVLPGPLAASSRTQALSSGAPPALYLKAVQVPAVRPSREFRAQLSGNISRRSAFAIVNPSRTESTQVLVTALGDTERLTVPPLQRIARFAEELLGRPPGPGLIRFESKIPIAVGGIELVEPEGLWVTLPVESVDYEEELSTNWRKWQSQAGQNYEFDIAFYSQWGLSHEPVRVVVEDGVIVLAQRVDDGTIFPNDAYPTMDDLFERLQSYIELPADSFRVHYDPTYGYPRQARIDPQLGWIDDELDFFIFRVDLVPEESE